MSLSDCQGSCYAIRELMKAAQADIDHGGDIKPARRKWPTADPKKTAVCRYKQRLLRFAARTFT